MIALVRWGEPADNVFLPQILRHCDATCYASLWHSSIKTTQQDTNVFFVVYHTNIHANILSVSRISDAVVAKYGHIAAFMVDMHHIYIRTRMDASWILLSLMYRVDDKDIEKEIRMVGRMEAGISGE